MCFTHILLSIVRHPPVLNTLNYDIPFNKGAAMPCTCKHNVPNISILMNTPNTVKHSFNKHHSKARVRLRRGVQFRVRLKVKVKIGFRVLGVCDPRSASGSLCG